jgi:hypothetical protein
MLGGSWRRSAIAPSFSGAGGTFPIDCAAPPGSTARTANFALHSAQKFALERLRYPQAGQATSAGEPHSMQNLARSGRVARQVRHCICLASQLLKRPSLKRLNPTSVMRANRGTDARHKLPRGHKGGRFDTAARTLNEQDFIRVPSDPDRRYLSLARVAQAIAPQVAGGQPQRRIGGSTREGRSGAEGQGRSPAGFPA